MLCRHLGWLYEKDSGLKAINNIPQAASDDKFRGLYKVNPDDFINTALDGTLTAKPRQKVQNAAQHFQKIGDFHRRARAGQLPALATSSRSGRFPTPRTSLLSITAAQQNDGMVRIWAVDAASTLYSNAQTSPGGDWTGWTG